MMILTVKIRHVKCYFTLVLLRREYSETCTYIARCINIGSQLSRTMHKHIITTDSQTLHHQVLVTVTDCASIDVCNIVTNCAS
jgi:hypothetical protein